MQMKRKQTFALVASAMLTVLAGFTTACSKMDDPVNSSSDDEYVDYWGEDESDTFQPLPEGAVDLGLPSGNLWADRNVGASEIEDDGLYFAWGEIEGHRLDLAAWYNTSDGRRFEWEFYKFYGGSAKTVTTYTNSDGRDMLSLEDDAARVLMGGDWIMPDIDDIKELMDFCDSEYTTSNGKAGWRFTSRENGNSIFMPASSKFYTFFIKDGYGKVGEYWTSNVCGKKLVNNYPEYSHTDYDDESYAVTLRFYDYGSGHPGLTVGNISRELGAPVRGIIHGENKLRLVDLGLPSGNLWASHNLGATMSNRKVGCYYTYGDTEGHDAVPSSGKSIVVDGKGVTHYYDTYGPHAVKQEDGYIYSEETYKWGTFVDGVFKLTKYCTDERWGFVDGKEALDTEDDPVRLAWGGKWHMPTVEEYNELFENCYLRRSNLDGIPSTAFVSKRNGNSIILPWGGYREGAGLSYYYYGGYYRCSGETGRFLLGDWDMSYDNMRRFSDYYDKPVSHPLGFLVRPVRYK